MQYDHHALNLTIQGLHWPQPHLRVTSGGRDQRLFQTSSLEEPIQLLVTSGGQDERPIQTFAQIRWMVTEAWASGRYASY